MKKWFTIAAAAMLSVLLAACGAEEVPTQEVAYDMTFANRTGRNVAKLEIRPSEEADWCEITLTEAEWKSSYEIPVSLQGQVPPAENGWQVQMTFVGEDTAVWENVFFSDTELITFSMDETGETMVQTVPEEEALTDCDPADAETEDRSAWPEESDCGMEE